MKQLVLLLVITLPMLGQSRYSRRYPQHNLTGSFGAGLPRGDLKPFFGDSFGLSASYGYRFHEYFQADAGFDTVFHAARVKDFFETQVGDLRIRDYQYFVPVGGRAILPLARGRVLFFGGGGGAYMRYQESIRQPFGDAYFRIECRVCRARSGWGHYALAGTNVFLDRRKMVRFGFTTKVYRGNTSGEAFGALPAFRTRDQWINTFAEFGVSF